MEQTVVYKLETPKDIYIKHIQKTDIIPIYDVLNREGCPKTENRFSTEDFCIDLDAIQRRAAQRNKTSPHASADFLICVEKNKVLFADAKFRCKNVKNIDKKELLDKRKESKAMITDGDYHIQNEFYLIFKSSVLKGTERNYLKRIVDNTPSTRFLTAIEFEKLFDR